MTNIALQIAVERARTAALTGSAAAFAEIRRGIEAIDREGAAPERELAMLGVVAGARMADPPAVDACMDTLRPLAPREWDVLRSWLFAAPEMSIPAFAEFVHGLDREVRESTRAAPARRWTPLLAIALVASVASVVVLALRLVPDSPEAVTNRAIEAILAGDGQAALEALPDSWGASIRKAGSLLAQHADPEATVGTRAAFLQLASAIESAGAATDADRIAVGLFGAGSGRNQLRRLGDGVRALGNGPWCDLGTWGDEAWRWRPSGDAAFAWRTLLRHLPLTAWFGGWFSGSWRCESRALPEVSVHPTATSASDATVRIRIGLDNWPAMLDRHDRCWLPSALVERWQVWQPAIAPQRCTPEATRALQDSIRGTAEALERWIRRMSASGDISPPPSIDAPWWVP